MWEFIFFIATVAAAAWWLAGALNVPDIDD